MPPQSYVTHDTAGGTLRHVQVQLREVHGILHRMLHATVFSLTAGRERRSMRIKKDNCYALEPRTAISNTLFKFEITIRDFFMIRIPFHYDRDCLHSLSKYNGFIDWNDQSMNPL